MLRDDLAVRWRAIAWDGGPIWAAVLIGIMVAPTMLAIEGSCERVAAESASRSADVVLSTASIPEAPTLPTSGESERTKLAAQADLNPQEQPPGAIGEFDPFNAYARAEAAPARAVEIETVDGYLFEAYRRLPVKRDSSGDFTWKDPAAAERFGLPLDRYVIGGMDPDFKELVYAAGKRMDADGIKWSILAGFRDDWRQQIASGYKASAQNSCHGGSRAVGGYGNGRCIDVSAAEGPPASVYAWIDGPGRAFGLLRPIPGSDPPHVGTVADWRAIAERLRGERLTGSMLATVRALAGSDAADGLTGLALPPAPAAPITAALDMAMAPDPPASKPLPTHVGLRRHGERKAGRHARLCSRRACTEPAS